MSPRVEIELDEIVDFLIEDLGIEALSEKMTALGGIDWNPFDEDGDEYESIWSEMQHNFSLVWQATDALVFTAERIVVNGIELSAPEKHRAVVAALDRAIRLPWYAEPFDGPLLDMIVVGAVNKWNSIDWFDGSVKLTAVEVKK
jgi:hypothetical protein